MRVAIIINNTLTAAGDLSRVQDGPVNQYCPHNIVHAKIEGTVDLAILNTDITTAIRVLFFMRLPIGDQNANNAAGAACNLYAFTGPSNYLTIPLSVHQTLIYEHPNSVDDTCDLLPPTITSPCTSINIKSKVTVIHKQVTKLTCDRILEQIFKNICPTFVGEPFSALCKVRQVTRMLSDGSMHTSSIRDYYQIFRWSSLHYLILPNGHLIYSVSLSRRSQQTNQGSCG
jgi:hypothetical protein